MSSTTLPSSGDGPGRCLPCTRDHQHAYAPAGGAPTATACPSSVAPFYGGATGVSLRLEAARAAVERYAVTGVVDMVPAYKAGDQTAAMFFEIDYYGNEDLERILSLLGLKPSES